MTEPDDLAGLITAMGKREPVRGVIQDAVPGGLCGRCCLKSRAPPRTGQPRTRIPPRATLRRVAMTDVARYEPRSSELTWPRSAAERAVARDGRLMQQIITEKTLAALQAAELDRTLA